MPPAHICARYRRWLPLWAAIAALNIAIGIALAANPERASDFDTIRRWSGEWLFDGRDLYSSPRSGTDYPPHAILTLSPVSLLPDAAAVPVWSAFNLLLLIAAPLLAARIVRPHGSWTDGACLAVFFLGWSGSKTLLQFTLLTLVLGLAAMVLARRRPWWSGACLGLALMKPQIGLPFLLWVVLTRRWRVAAGAAAILAAGSLLWCIRAGADPLHVAIRYFEILTLYYGSEGGMVGVSQAGPLFARVLPAGPAGAVSAVVSIGLLAVICVEGWRPGQSGDRFLYPAPAMAAVWSLLTFYHLSYGFVLLLPAAAALLLTDDPRTARLRHVVFWLMQVALVVDVPGLWRRFGSETVASPSGMAFTDFYRVALMVFFGALWAIQRRTASQNPITV
ncbi:MAG TPA: glycosyltransferase family 87 protein [Vicinamibacterales bacterium]|nr:glycosyltransferase family 87 protein [Vicinamibacterales bacterium]